MKLYIITTLLVLLSVSSYDAKPAKRGLICPDLVACFVDPCQVSKCPAYPDAKCVSDYCGSCNARWYLNDKEIDCTASVSEPSVQTEDKDCQKVFCFVDPCGLAPKCNKHPDAICQANYCGSCNAWFYLHGKRVQCD